MISSQKYILCQMCSQICENVNHPKLLHLSTYVFVADLAAAFVDTETPKFPWVATVKAAPAGSVAV